MPYRTPNSSGGLSTCRRLVIPVEFLPHVYGALDALRFIRSWEETGDVTPDMAVDAMYAVLASWSECFVVGLGTILPVVTATLDAGLLACDGSTYQRVDYPDLYDVLHPSLIVDADSFRVPDLRGRVPVGAGAGVGLTSRAIDETFGEETHQITNDEMWSHAHFYSRPVTTAIVQALIDVPVIVSGVPVGGATGAAGSGVAHNNMQPSYGVQYAIVAEYV